MENCLNKGELRKKFKICAETLDKILDYLKLPFEIKIATNYKRVPYYNQESVNKIEKFMKEEYNSNFFMSLTLREKGWSIPNLMEEFDCSRLIIERCIKNLHLDNGDLFYFYCSDEDKNKIKEYLDGINKEDLYITPIHNVKREYESVDFEKRDKFYVGSLCKYFHTYHDVMKNRLKFLKIELTKDKVGEFITNEQFVYLKNYLETHNITEDMRNSHKCEYEGYTLLSSFKKSLNITNIPYRYCEFLGIEIYDFYNTLSGHTSHYIKNEDCEKLINYVNSKSTEERRDEMVRFTSNKKFGCDYPLQSEDVKSKIKDTNLGRYGVINPLQNEEIKKKAEETNLIKYGAKNPFQADDFREKADKSLIEKYGSLENYKEYQVSKSKATKLERYGDENYVNSDKCRETCLEKYGEDNIFKTQYFREKREQTSLLKYGTPLPMNCEEIRERSREAWSNKSDEEMKNIMEKHFHKWIFNGLRFDSKWEIVYYFYLVSNNIKFKMQVPLSYKEGNEDRTYLCDFYLIDTDELIEIKNPRCLDENGNLKIFYKSDSQSKLDAKNKCMIDNNVKILSKNEMKPYVDYFRKNCKIPIINNKTNEISNKVPN